jgi:hypothetical protein
MKLHLEPMGSRSYEVIRGMRYLGIIRRLDDDWLALAGSSLRRRAIGHFETAHRAITALDDAWSDRGQRDSDTRPKDGDACGSTRE